MDLLSLRTRWDTFKAVQIIGLLGLILTAIRTVQLTKDLHPERNRRLERILEGDFETLWLESPWLESNPGLLRPDITYLTGYLYFTIYSFTVNILIVLSSIIKERWIIALWIFCEIFSLCWHVYFYLPVIRDPEMVVTAHPYLPKFLDGLSNVTNIGTALYSFIIANRCKTNVPEV